MNIDTTKTEAFAGQVVTDVAATFSGVMGNIGHKLGLYKAMAGSGAMTPRALSDKTNTHERYIREWLNKCHEGGNSPLLRSSRRGGALGAYGMSTQAISARVRYYGRLIGVDNLSSHDLRHTWATLAAKNGTALNDLMNAGGWNSYSMPLGYIEGAKIANEGVIF